jgi:hypothetical protein
LAQFLYQVPEERRAHRPLRLSLGLLAAAGELDRGPVRAELDPRRVRVQVSDLSKSPGHGKNEVLPRCTSPETATCETATPETETARTKTIDTDTFETQIRTSHLP